MPVLLTSRSFSPCVFTFTKKVEKQQFLSVCSLDYLFAQCLNWKAIVIRPPQALFSSFPDQFMQLNPSEYILASFFLGLRSFLSGFSVLCGFFHQLFFSDIGQNPRMGKAENLSRALAVIAYIQLFSCKERISPSQTWLNSVRPLGLGKPSCNESIIFLNKHQC